MMTEREAVLLITVICTGITLLLSFITVALVQAVDRRRKKREQK